MDDLETKATSPPRMDRSGLYRRRSASNEENEKSFALQNHNSKKPFRKQATLTLITVEEDEHRVMSSLNAMKLRESPPPYYEVAEENLKATQEDLHEEIVAINMNSASHSINSRLRQCKVEPFDLRRSEASDESFCSKFNNFLSRNPVLKLFLVIIINGFVSMAFAAIFVELEAPAQKRRRQDQDSLGIRLDHLEANLTQLLRSKGPSIEAFEQFRTELTKYHQIPKEITWEMLSASAFINSVSSTTGLKISKISCTF